MGQKVRPTGIRLGIVKDHTSVWYADKKSYADYLLNDLQVRQYLRKRLSDASVGRIEICLLYTSPSPRDLRLSRMPSSA